MNTIYVLFILSESDNVIISDYQLSEKPVPFLTETRTTQIHATFAGKDYLKACMADLEWADEDTVIETIEQFASDVEILDSDLIF
ncbi:hypothetical protein [Pseudoalteromonas phage J2-1_QLiu-2017]|nr:hypothetical protein [Pseudoalteromonas phage J2-1_QLiu-2017]